MSFERSAISSNGFHGATEVAAEGTLYSDGAEAQDGAEGRSPGVEPILSVEGVGKCYRLYQRRADRVKQAMLGRFARYYKPFWALRDVSFDIMPGESIGIIGANGSGKSTLLQIIAGTTTPTTGRAVVRGRIAALLELGSGFNPQFTGRENVYMAGAILGIPRREIEARFDEITDFADIDEFIDQPVMLYSSGMHARLAFAVAVTVRPDILILDEILAVGDMGFQAKCVNRIRRMLREGVSLLFVSHGPDAVKMLCQKGLLLIKGQQAYFGSVDDAVNRYIEHLRRTNNEEALRTQQDLLGGFELSTPVASKLRYGSGHVQIEHVRLLDDDGREAMAYRSGDRVTVEATLVSKVDIDRVDLAFLIRDRSGLDMTGGAGSDYGVLVPAMRAGERCTMRLTLPCPFRPGRYGVTLTLTRLGLDPAEMGLTLDHVDGCATFGLMPSATAHVRYLSHQPAAFEVIGVGQGVEAPPEVQV